MRTTAALPVEIGFLAALGVAPDRLLRATALARRIGVSPDRALIADGFPAERFYRLLARHLGVPFIDRPMRLSLPPGLPLEGLAHGTAVSRANRLNIDVLMAPRGRGLAALLREIAPGRGRVHRFAIATPRHLQALALDQAGAAIADQASVGLGAWDDAWSAVGGSWAGQRAVGAALLGTLILGLVLCPHATATLAAIAFAVLFLASILLRLCATVLTPGRSATKDPALPEAELPTYTILVPLYREAAIAAELIEALDRLDYPAAKLDIKLLVETDDHETRQTLAAMSLPDRYDVVVAPPGHPRTKPRALNVGLLLAHGDLVVVFDAEDRPAPDQLKAAAARFRCRPSKVACLQARLAVDHLEETWLTRMYGLEYAALFGVVKPGLMRAGLPIPLGGTSNHFRIDALRRAGGWDAWNVTEDIDLGFRLARLGYRVEALDSTTAEEAPLTVDRWLAQRTRWLKGWMVTLMVHTRQPVRLFRELGPAGGAAVSISLLGTIASSLLGPFFVLVLGWRLGQRSWWTPHATPDALWGATGVFLLLCGMVSALWPQAIALRRDGRLGLMVWCALLPLYLCLVSLAAWRALAEAVWEPQRWRKTEHGLAARRGPPSSPSVGTRQAATFQAPRPLALIS